MAVGCETAIIGVNVSEPHINVTLKCTIYSTFRPCERGPMGGAFYIEPSLGDGLIFDV